MQEEYYVLKYYTFVYNKWCVRRYRIEEVYHANIC